MNDNNNIDDLFKRAADQYPLRTDSADWDKVLAAMDDDDPSMIIPPLYREGGRSRRRFLWLLLLLPVGGLGYYAMTGGGAAKQQTTVQSPGSGDKAGENRTTEGVPGTAGQAQAAEPIGSGSGEANRRVDEANRQPGATGYQPGTGTEKMTGNENATRTTERFSRGKPLEEQQIQAGVDKTMQRTGRGGRSNKLQTANGGAGSVYKTSGVVGQTNGNREAGMDKSGESGTDAKRETGTVAKREAGLAGVGPLASINDPLSLSVADPSGFSPKGVTKPGIKISRSKEHSFYAGIVLAPDLSFIKFQSVKATGYTAGLVIGYNINSRLALETGVYFDKKKYYTSGEYFNKKNVPWLSNYTVLSADGVCNMLEIPVNLRYNFKTKGVGGWFVTGGLSTYLMMNEQYGTTVKDSGGWVSDWGYTNKKHSQYFFSVFNMSVGYQKRLGGIGDLRLEPYLKIPLSGMGSGELPIMSAGFNIGITRRIK